MRRMGCAQTRTLFLFDHTLDSRVKILVVHTIVPRTDSYFLVMCKSIAFLGLLKKPGNYTLVSLQFNVNSNPNALGGARHNA
jgi:hypothetical protein